MKKHDSKSEPKKTAKRDRKAERPSRKIKLLSMDELKDVTGGTCDGNGPPHRLC